ncbi:unnamed protein product [Cylicostephanus goldi]|uniref:Uncharacterized protein n=1 Tax=Cylicostephanus goldi TaxID=71465 RepID=A0A3P7PZ56_CYLGO|nr:unnamed protein product [Cylicostephanus goldi]
MKPSLLAIVFLTGIVYSKRIWDVFDLFFGNNEEDPEENLIIDDENRHASDRKQENPADKGVGGEDSNEIPYKNINPLTGKRIDNRVGWIYPIKHDVRTEEGYKSYLHTVLQYLKNLSTQDHGLGEGAGPAYTQLDQRFGAYDEFGNFYWDDDDPYDDGGGDLDNDGDVDDFDYDYGNFFGHDELK